MNRSYVETTSPNPHIARGREIIKKYPEVRNLMGPYPLSAIYTTLIVATQIFTCFLLKDQSWLVLTLTAYLFGSFLSHGLFTFLHEASHNLIFKKTGLNQVMGILTNIGSGLPAFEGFKIFHLIHHSNMGECDLDADIPSHFEAKLVGNSTIKKIIWFINFGFVQCVFRPGKIKGVKLWYPRTVLNLIYIIISNALIFHFFGLKGLSYILLSSFFGLGLHPLGARWIQEHFIFKKGQETYSYYGILNKLSFNIGYHNEHHDLFRVPWINLPKLKKMAPEFYDDLYAHKSWTKLLFTFLFNPKYDLYCRISRPGHEERKRAEATPVNGLTT